MIYLYFNSHQSKLTWLILSFLYPLHCYWFYGFIKKKIHARIQQRKRSQYNKMFYNNEELKMILNNNCTHSNLYIIGEEDDYFIEEKRRQKTLLISLY
jgi:hypothetical protein